MSRIILAGLIPAAGASRRLGRDKRRVPFRGATVLEATVEVLRRGGLQPLLVVLEAGSPCRHLPGLAGTVVVENPDPERGMLSSIREGLAAIPPEVHGVAVLPGDHPLVPVAAVQALYQRFCEARPGLLVPSYGGRRGHPLILHRQLFAAAAACADSQGLRQLLDSHAGELEVLELPAGPAEQDLDSPEDLIRLQQAEEEEP